MSRKVLAGSLAATLAFGAIPMSAITVAEAAPISQAGNGETASPDWTDPKGADVTDRAIPSGYAADPAEGRVTFGIVDLTDYNQYLKDGGHISNDGFYLTFSKSDDGKIYARLVDKETNEMVQELTLSKDKQSFSHLDQYKDDVLKNVSTPTTDVYPQLSLVDVPSNQPGTSVSFVWSNGSNFLQSDYILDTQSREGQSKVSAIQMFVPIELEQLTKYWSVNTANGTFDASNPAAYELDGTEGLIGTWTQTGLEGSAYIASGVRDFDKYELFRADTNLQGVLGRTTAFLDRSIVYDNPEYNTKTQAVTIDNKGNVRNDLYVVEPENTFDVIQSYNNKAGIVGAPVGYLSIDPNSGSVSDAELERIANMRTDELLAEGLVVSADAATPQQKRNPAIYSGYRYLASSENMALGTIDQASHVATYTVTLEGVPTTTTNNDKDPNNNNRPTGTPGTFTFTVVTANFGGQISNRPWVLGDSSAYRAGGVNDFGVRLYWTTIDNNGAITNYNDLVKIGGVGSVRFTNPYGVMTDANHLYIEKGSVIVKYVDEQGNEIQDPVTDTDHETSNVSYDTVDKRDEKITTPDGKTYRYKEIQTPADPTTRETGEVQPGSETITRVRDTTDETGNVEAGTNIVVTYVYEEVKGSVVVNYVDEDGNPLKDPVVDTPETSTGTPYDTTDNRPETIETPDGKTYVRVPERTVGDETGNVVEGETKVTYVYREVKGSVVVDYKVLGTDEVLQPRYPDTPLSSTGVAYDTTEDGEMPAEIVSGGKTYRLVPDATDGATTGTVVEGETVITYYYELVTGDVIVHYVDEDGNTIANDVWDEKDTATDEAYDTTDHKPGTITADNGKTYVIVPEKTVGNETGKVVEGETHVTYVYREVSGAVVVHYVDEDGNPIAEDQVDTAEGTPVNTPYDTTDNGMKPTTIEHDGYTYTLVPEKTEGNETGNVVEGVTEVTYVYKRTSGDVIVHYVDEDGNPIADDVVDMPKNTPVDTPYDTTDNRPEKIETPDGKTYVRVPEKTEGDETGGVTPGTTEVTYVYREVKGTVVVNYEDEDGNPLKDPVVDTPETSTGTPYDTTDNRPEKIKTPDGKTYERVPEKTEGDETGKVTPGETEVTYVYKEVKGSVFVDYKVLGTDEVLQPRYTDTDESSTGVPYDTTEDGEMPQTLTKDGVTYVLVPAETKGETKGTVPEGETVITYYYVPAGDVVVHYEDEDGNPIQDPKKDEENTPVDEPYDTTDNRPEKIKTPDGKTYERVPEKTKGDETGKVTPGETKVTYVYKEVKGTVVVDYKIKGTDTQIKDRVVDTPESSTGVAYDTTDHKPETITYNGQTYRLVVSATSGAETGTVVEGETVITYYYELVTETTGTSTGKNGGKKLPKSGIADVASAASAAGVSGLAALLGALGLKRRKK